MAIKTTIQSILANYVSKRNLITQTHNELKGLQTALTEAFRSKRIYPDSHSPMTIETTVDEKKYAVTLTWDSVTKTFDITWAELVEL